MLKKDDTVRLAPGFGKAAEQNMRFKVVEIDDRPRVKNRYVVEPVNGGTRRRGPEEAFEKVAYTDAGVELLEFLPPVHPGEVVTVKDFPKISPDVNYVVLKQKNDDTVSIARLGGEGGNYWPSIPRRCLDVVSL